jgi:methyl-accepting chemotaxis protein
MDIDVKTLQESHRRLAPRADQLAQTFYDTLFARCPDVFPLFEGVRLDDQKRKLARALSLVVGHMERPEFLRPYLQGLGALHVAYGVRSEHYPLFADCMLAALAQTAGHAWSGEEARTWEAALQVIAEAMLIGAERVA